MTPHTTHPRRTIAWLADVRRLPPEWRCEATTAVRIMLAIGGA